MVLSTDHTATDGLSMIVQKLYSALNQHGSNVLIAGTQFLSRKKWLNIPDFSASTLGQGAFQYRINRHWCQADPAKHPVNNCHEMVIDSQQRLYLLTDHPKNNIIVFDTQGNVLDSWTLDLNGAHGLTLTHDGENEFLWICDPYRGHVVKTTLQGNALQTLPTPHQVGAYHFSMPYAPTQTAVAPNGDIYVADGYGSQCVIQYNARGKYIQRFGGKNAGDSTLDFAHGIAVDNRRGAGNEILLVTSRKQSCIKQFTLDGKYLGTIALSGGYPCRPVIHGDSVVIGLCWSGAHLKPNSGFVIMLDKNNQICATLGGHIETAKDTSKSFLVSDYSCFHHVHDVCADANGNLYVCEWNAGNIYPVKLELI